ncbi:MAG TPA: ATP synthase F1 subunit epsilon [Pyrinomonadaceae bacterium]|nr:ATP synthase F1 subunit epsilon [Pyrinomonadaceae bacterium]
MLNVEIVTPEKIVFDSEVDYVSVPTASGEIGILPSHAPLVSKLSAGILTCSLKSRSERFAISGGFLEVNSDKVSVLAEYAVTSDDVSLEAARAEKEAAETELDQKSADDKDVEDLLRKIQFAEAKMLLAKSDGA